MTRPGPPLNFLQNTHSGGNIAAPPTPFPLRPSAPGPAGRLGGQPWLPCPVSLPSVLARAVPEETPPPAQLSGEAQAEVLHCGTRHSACCRGNGHGPGMASASSPPDIPGPRCLPARPQVRTTTCSAPPRRGMWARGAGLPGRPQSARRTRVRAPGRPLPEDASSRERARSRRHAASVQ